MAESWPRAGGIPGPEDFALDSSRGEARLLCASLDRRRKGANGAIFSVTISATGFGPHREMRLIGRDSVPLRPLGACLGPSRPGKPPLLYVINRPGESPHRIEVFEVHDTELVQAESPMSSALLTDPNDLVALASGELYVTNSSAKGGLSGGLEKLFKARRPNVVRRAPDGTWAVVARGIGFANGIEIDAAERTVYVAALSEGVIRVYLRSPTDGDLVEQAPPIKVGSGVDNLIWESPGILNVAAHPSPLAFVLHAKFPSKKSPSQAYVVDVAKRAVQLALEDDGKRVSACSTALRYGGRWYLGQVLDDGLVCAPDQSA